MISYCALTKCKVNHRKLQKNTKKVM